MKNCSLNAIASAAKPQGDNPIYTEAFAHLNALQSAVVTRTATPLRNCESHAAMQVRKRQLSQLCRDLRSCIDALHTLATTDALTGLPNYGASMARLNTEFARAGRYGHPLSVAMYDLDGFGEINRRLGHQRTNEILATVCAVLRENARSSDIIGRFGGDELLLILPQTGGDDACGHAVRLAECVADFSFPDVSVTLTPGVATLLPTDEDAAALLYRACSALRLAKCLRRKDKTIPNLVDDVEFIV